MKAILISIRPQHVCNIFNLIKLLEIRKKFPKDYVGWVYIYCTKENDKHEICIYDEPIEHKIMCSRYHFLDNGEETRIALFNPRYIKGKVIARFWCNKVEELMFLEGLYSPLDRGYCTDTLDNAQVEIKSCVPQEKIIDYLYSKGKGYAIHITNLEIFDKPKEISEFYFAKTDKLPRYLYPLTRGPQSWCYVEV